MKIFNSAPMTVTMAVLATAALMATGCSTFKRHSTQTGGPAQGTMAGDDGSGLPPQQAEVIPPIHTQPKIKPKVALVLGPGAYKTFAYASFLKAIRQTGLPVDKVIGVEWGALAGAFFALNDQPHEAEWKLYKLEKSNLENRGFFGVGESNKTTVQKLESYLKENLGRAETRKTKLPFSCPVFSLSSGTVRWANRPYLWQTVESCLASPPRFAPVKADVAALHYLPEIGEQLRREGFGVIILVNVLNDGDLFKGDKLDWPSKWLWLEARRRTWLAKRYFTDVIDVNTRDFGLFDFRAKGGLAKAGEAAGRQAARDLIEKYKF